MIKTVMVAKILAVAAIGAAVNNDCGADNNKKI
jgi:hypothetical protein